MPIDRSIIEIEETQINLAAKRIGRYLSQRMQPDKAYSVKEVHQMLDDLAKADTQLAKIIPIVPWYEFVGGFNDLITIMTDSSGKSYYAIRKK